MGGIVGVLGGLGGFVGPILFGYLLDWTGIWTTSWMFLFVVSLICLVWMHTVIRRMLNARAPEMTSHIDELGTPILLPIRVACPEHGVNARASVIVTAPEEPEDAPSQTKCLLHSGHSEEPCEVWVSVRSGS